MTTPISALDLRIGMFVHLNVGWMSHPFPLSSFKITSAEQIETIRSLRCPRLAWSPERSDPEAVARPEPAPVDAPALVEAAASEAPPAPVDERQVRQRALAAQLEAAQRCEQQFAEACRDLRRATDRVLGEPTQAAAEATQLARALLDKMFADGEPCLRVLGEMAGDRFAAHAMNVTVVSLMLARQLALPQAVLMDLGVGALMHDVGKVALPERVRSLRDDFDAREAALYRDHVAQGLILGRRMGLPAASQLVIAQHHEHADGTGFPSALMLPRMSLPARIVALVNRFDNLCNGATPAQSLTPHEALSRLFAQCRSKFDETLLSAFIKMMGIYPPGSVVQLNDDRYAMVMTVNAAHPLKPRVLVHEAGATPEEALLLDLQQQPLLGIRRSLKAAQLPTRVLDYLKPRQRVSYFFDVEPRPRERLAEEALA